MKVIKTKRIEILLINEQSVVYDDSNLDALVTNASAANSAKHLENILKHFFNIPFLREDVVTYLFATLKDQQVKQPYC